MGLKLYRDVVLLVFGMAFFVLSNCLFAQESNPVPSSQTASTISQASIPDAPTPHLTDEDPSAGTPAPQIELAQATPAATGSESKSASARSSSSSQNSAQQPDTQQTQHDKAEEQIRQQEHQRVAGIVPSFNVSYLGDQTVSLSSAEKFKLQLHAAVDPYTFSLAFIVAGLAEAEGSSGNDGFGWGPGGYFKRMAAEYGDNVIGNTLGNAVLPSILHQDPRYYRLGHGSITHRVLYSFATTFICKHDNTGKWEPNYSNVVGNMIAGEISQFYYPNGDVGKVGQAVDTGFTVTFEGAFGSELQEFWPDISRKFFHKDPTHGLDAQARAADAARKQKKQEEKQNNQQ
ncbi:MAG: hypothetical protein ABSD59_10395 [Terracidiphilus sp.]|jgi:hypothetical protein